MGISKIKDELSHLKKVERKEVQEKIAIARGHGDLSENAEYNAEKERQGFIEAKISDLEDKISRAHVIDPTKISNDSITFGATVSLKDEATNEIRDYCIVSDYESNINNGLLSIKSPTARSLIGKFVGDFIEVTTPKGVKSYEILSITYEPINLDCKSIA